MSERNGIYYAFAVVRLLLYPLTLIYGAVVWMRNRLYDSGFFSTISFSVPVISVGNLSVGGTGKTPHVEYLIRLLQYHYQVATMSRGYKRRTQGFQLADEQTNALRIGDEPMQYHLKYPDVTVCVAEERITGIPRLLQLRPEVDVVLLDDAYQHRSVKPGVNILITDFNHPFYEDYILPYGRLREGRNAYKRADIIIVSKCTPQLSEQEKTTTIQKINPDKHQSVFFTTIQYDTPRMMFTDEAVTLKGKQVILVCGIAKPDTLIAQLKQQASAVHVLSYPDHHYFITKDLEEIRAAFAHWNSADTILVTTEKDAARLHLHADKIKEWQLPIAIQPIKIEFLFNEAPRFDALIQQYVADAIQEHLDIHHPAPPDYIQFEEL